MVGRRRIWILFQPFLRFYRRQLEGLGLCHRVVSTLLEILSAMNMHVVSVGKLGDCVFQPFLRF